VKRVIGGLVLLVALATPAAAHETRTVGPFDVTIGWGNEPPLTGLPNSIDVVVARVDRAPLAASASLAVEVVFGTARVTLPLAGGGAPGLFRAEIVPTRAGTYSFHITGKIGSDNLDVVSGCSGETFDCVADGTAVQFPAKDPPSGQLLTRLEREHARVARAERDGTRARRVAFVALVVAAVALVFAVRQRRRHV
jgi:hypothetical protein